ncbi:MAG: hypothetical protein ACHQD8_01185 [Chitinophagales bacterium]
MRNKLLLSIVLLVMLFSFGSCVMHYDGHGSAKIRHYYYHGPRHHFGNARHHNVRTAFWGKHRYGPRPHNYRGKYR